MHHSNQGIHICKLNHIEICNCTNDLDTSTYQVYLITIVSIWLYLHSLIFAGCAKYGFNIINQIRHYFNICWGFTQIVTYHLKVRKSRPLGVKKEQCKYLTTITKRPCINTKSTARFNWVYHNRFHFNCTVQVLLVFTAYSDAIIQLTTGPIYKVIVNS